MKYWQIAAGTEARCYTDTFLLYGMAFVGGDVQVETMRRVEVGDRVLLKRGMSELVAVGEVVERDGRHRGEDDKDWLRDFDGWDLLAYCFVNWHTPSKPIGVNGLTRATIQLVHKKHLQEQAEKVLRDEPATEEYAPEPAPTKLVTDQQMLEFLVQQGMRPGSAEELTSTFNRIRLLARYYYDQEQWADVREHETRTFLVVPLLLALGWAEQQMKIEVPAGKGKRADLVCFSKPYQHGNMKGSCAIIIETKGFRQGLDHAPGQVIAYAKVFPECPVVVVTNGYCYKVFRRDEEGEFDERPSAYLNLLNLRERYPLDPVNVDGCREVLRLLLPRLS